MDSTFTLHLIRHAPTKGNKAKQYIGWTDEAILPFAAKQDLCVQKVWGSDLMRCRQTAELLFPNAVYHADANWRECHFGEWERKTYEELKDIPYYRKWIDHPAELTPPGGESFAMLAARVDRAVLALPGDGEFTIVTHGGPIRYLLSKGTEKLFHQQTALHSNRYTIVWPNREAFEEGSPCISCSVEPLTANVNM